MKNHPPGASRKKRFPKGSFGYLKWQRKWGTLRTILLYLLSVAVYGLGIWSTGSNRNLLTVVAVLGLLPASKSTVNTVMFFRYHGLTEDVRAKLLPLAGNCTVLEDLVFTSQQKDFPVGFLALGENRAVAFASDGKMDCSACEGHLSKMLSQDGLIGYEVRAFTELTAYQNALRKLGEGVVQTESRRKQAEALFLAISI